MPVCSNHRMAAAAALALALWSACPVRGEEPAAETVTVSKTYNNAPFQYQMRLLAERAECRVYHLSYPSPVVTALRQNNTVPADYYLPKNVSAGGHRYPAVICLHILDGNEPLTDLMCSVLAARGIPAISFKLPYYGERGTGKGPVALAEDPKLFVGAMAQVGEDLRRTIDLLDARPEIDPERIGVTGISLGGIIAASAAGGEPRLHRASLILAGGDLPCIIAHARETELLNKMLQKLPAAERAEVDAKIAAVDPLHFAPGLVERARNGQVLMINAAEDEVIPRQCTEKLANALGIKDRVTWLEGLGHYTAMAELPRALRMTADFFARDLPPGAQPPAPPADEETSPLRRLVALVSQAAAMLTTEPSAGHCHYVDVELSAVGPNGRPIAGKVQLIRGPDGKFAIRCRLPELGEIALGQGRFPWMLAGGTTVVAGTKNPVESLNPLSGVEPRHVTKLRVLRGIVDSMVLAPEVLEQWILVTAQEPTPANKAATGGRAPNDALSGPALRITAKDPAKTPGEVRLVFREDGRIPASAHFSLGDVQGTVQFHGWQMDAVGPETLFEPPEGRRRDAVDQADLCRVFSALVNFAAERMEPPDRLPRGRPSESISVVARDPAGHGILCQSQGKTILMVSGTPAEMGAAHGTLLCESARKLSERVLYLVGGGDTIRSGQWFFDRMAEIERRTLPHIPPRFVEECDALAKAAGVSQRDARYANLFAERFHCSGVALRGAATTGRRVLHARVLDYMRDIDLQQSAAAMVFMPAGRHKWISLGYAGFIGTVTAMNEKGLAVGEMGGGGDGQWDGLPMNFLLRDLMERAATVEDALTILRTTPRTCEYYYVLSDRSGELRALHCTPQEIIELTPGQQHPRLPYVPQDTVLVSGDERARLLSQRLVANYGRIDVPRLIDIIKRPVAMQSNLHDAIFAPETLEMWFADAGPYTPACDEPYAHVELRKLIEFYERMTK